MRRTRAAVIVAMDGLVPVTVLTGFLGAGKTTLLNRLLKLRGDMPRFERVMIEAAGLADPAPILHKL